MLGPLWRGACLLIHVLLGATLAGIALLSGAVRLPCRWVPPVSRWWHRRLCRCLGLRLSASGQPQPGALLVANHISWLDVPVLGALGTISFVSKDEVRRWPLVGAMATAAGTLYIKRGAHQAGALVDQIAHRIAQGGSVLIFAEGTTSDGTGLRRFHPRLFAAAQRDGCPVQPVAIRYGSNAVPDAVAPFIGDDTLARHLLRVLARPGIRAEVEFLSAIDTAGGLDRRALADRARNAIAARLGLHGREVTTPMSIPHDRSRQRGGAGHPRRSATERHAET